MQGLSIFGLIVAQMAGEELSQRSSAGVQACNPEVSCGFELSVRSLLKTVKAEP